MNKQRVLSLLAGLVVLLLTTAVVGARPIGAPAAPQDTATTLVPSDVSSFALVAPEYKLFWNSAPPICLPIAPRTPAAPAVTDGETISRIASYGSAVRQLYDDLACGSPKILSNIVADADYVYFTTSGGLMRLSVYANVGDAPELMNGLYGVNAELAQDDNNIYVLQVDNHEIDLVPKATPLNGYYEVTAMGSSPSNLQVSDSLDFFLTERHFVYWLQGGDLERFDVKNATGPVTLGSGVTGYYAEGGREAFFGGSLHFSDLVFYGAGGSAYYYDNVGGSSHGPIYNSTDPTDNPQVVSLTTDADNLYLMERRNSSCNPFTCYNYVLVRTGRSGDTGQVPIYNSGAISQLNAPVRLTTDNTYLYWQDANSNGTTAVRRLPNDASALPIYKMRVTGLEVTQGIQNLTNDVMLIQNRRTFVRMYVTSDSGDVPNVGAQLSATWDGGSSLVPLTPVNPVGPRLTVAWIPVRSDINQSYLFELPLDWTTHTHLTLTGHLDPNGVPLETNDSINTLSVGPLTFVPSPRVSVNLVQFSYTMTGTLFTTPVTDTNQAISLVRRLWPISSTPGDYTDGTPGFRPRLWSLYDDGLGSRMDYTAGECNDYYQVNNGMVTDNRNLCASAYADNQLKAYRSEQGLPGDSFLYGLIPAGNGYTVRGQAFSSDHVSSGDAANPYTAAHEITHTAGRNHPFKGSSLDDNKCGNTPNDGAMDNNYPYADSAIGPANGSLEGFEPGDAALKIGMAVLPSKSWFDIIGYCGPRAISDYTYDAIYAFFPHSQAPSPLAQAFQLTPQSASDWLSAYGIISADGNSGTFDHLRRLSSVAAVPAFEPGPYSLRLLDSHGAILADHSFAPDVMHHGGGVMDFGLEVPFAAGTAQIQLIKSQNQVIASHFVSAHAPTISGVALQNPPSPVTGTVTLHWTAADLDGDPLTFDVLYTRDGGATFQPVVLDVSGAQTQFDTRLLGGGIARFRVIASDGLLTAQADSPSYSIANKPPVPHIDSPGNGDAFQYGQLVALLGDADDAQGTGVSGSGLVWTDQRGTVLGTGAAVYTSGLPVGTDVITLTATDSLNLKAATHITITVGDDFKPAGPTIAVGPAQVNWQVAPGTTALQTELVHIGNSGGGSLSWTAHSDQGWLTLSSLSGTAPFTLTVSANPAGMTNGQLRLAHLTITKPADGGPEQDVVILVQLAMGAVEDAPVAVLPQNHRVFLPAVQH